MVSLFHLNEHALKYLSLPPLDRIIDLSPTIVLFLLAVESIQPLPKVDNMPSRSYPMFESEGVSRQELESGYASAGSSETSSPEIYFTKAHLQFLNRQLQNLEPQGMSMGDARVIILSMS